MASNEDLQRQIAELTAQLESVRRQAGGVPEESESRQARAERLRKERARRVAARLSEVDIASELQNAPTVESAREAFSMRDTTVESRWKKMIIDD